MLNTYGISYLLVEGSIAADVDDRIRYLYQGRWKSLRSETRYTNFVGWLETLSSLYGVRILFSANLLTSCVTIRSVYQWWQKAYEDHGTPVTIHTPSLRRDLYAPSRIMKVAATFPGVGSAKLLDIEDKFDSIRDMVNADADRWRTVDGIGKKTAEAIVTYVEEK
jgi:ERCC4-type nuclease